MLEEAPVFSGERRLDQVVGKLIERDGVVAQESALAYLVAEAIVEGDAIFVGQVHLALSELEGRNGESDQHEQATRPKCQSLAGKVVDDANDASRFKSPKEAGIGAPPVLESGPSAIKARIDGRIDREPIDQLAPIIALQEVPHFAPALGACTPTAASHAQFRRPDGQLG